MKIRNQVCLTCSILSSIPNLILFYALTPGNLFFGNDTAAIALGIVAFCTSICSLYFGIPYYDDNTNEKVPMNTTLISGVSIGFVNMAVAIILTPAVLIMWGAGAGKTLKNIASLFF